MSQLEFLKLQIAMGLNIHGHQTQTASLVLLVVSLVSLYIACIYVMLHYLPQLLIKVDASILTMFLCLPIWVMKKCHHRIPVDPASC